MTLNPKDVRRQTFKKKYRGYDTEEVAEFLSLVSGELSEFQREKKELSDKADRLTLDLEKYQKIERTLQETLVQAQKSLEEARSRADREANLIIKEAEIKAQEFKAKSVRELDAVRRDIEVLKDQKKLFIVKFRSLIKSHLELLNVLEMDEDAAGAPEGK